MQPSFPVSFIDIIKQESRNVCLKYKCVCISLSNLIVTRHLWLFFLVDFAFAFINLKDREIGMIPSKTQIPGKVRAGLYPNPGGEKVSIFTNVRNTIRWVHLHPLLLGSALEEDGVRCSRCDFFLTLLPLWRMQVKYWSWILFLNLLGKTCKSSFTHVSCLWCIQLPNKIHGCHNAQQSYDTFPSSHKIPYRYVTCVKVK